MRKRFKKGRSIKYESTRARFERLLLHIFTAKRFAKALDFNTIKSERALDVSKTSKRFV